MTEGIDADFTMQEFGDNFEFANLQGTIPTKSNTNVWTIACCGPHVLLKISFLPSGETVGTE